MSGKYWNINSDTLFFDSPHGEREMSVGGHSGTFPKVCICCDPDDDKQAVQITLSPDDALQLADEIISVIREINLQNKARLEAAE